MDLGLFWHEAKLVEALWGEAGMRADPPGGFHSEDSSGGTASGGRSKGLGACSLKMGLTRHSKGTVSCPEWGVEGQ